MHQKPVYVDPNGASPVLDRGEPEAVAVVAGHGVVVRCSQPESGVLHGFDHVLRPAFVRDARKQGNEVGGRVDVDLPASDQIEVQVDAVLLVPELAFYGSGGLLCLLLEGGGVLPKDACNFRQVSIRLAQERVEEHVLHQEGTIRADPGLAVVALGKKLDEIGEPVVLGAHRTVLGGYQLGVDPMVAGYLVSAKLQTLHELVPFRGVVHPRLPRMTNIYESLPFGISFPVEILMPSF